MIEIEIIDNRLETLYNVLQFCSDHTKIFNTGERIAINQERGSLLDLKNLEKKEIELSAARFYHVSDKVEEKIDWALRLIQKDNWQPKPYGNEY